MMIEKMPILGGTTAKSGGVTWIFNHFIFREQGIDDKKDDALRYTVRYGYPRQYNPESPTLGLDENRYRVVEAGRTTGYVVYTLKRQGKTLYGFGG